MTYVSSELLNTWLFSSMESKARVETCYHCGDDCVTLVKSDNHNFCCHGCASVYQLLQKNELGEYYCIENKPGTSLKSRNKKKYDYLNEPEIAQKLIRYQDDSKSRIHFRIPQIHCHSCIYLLEKLNILNEGIIRSTVHFGKKEVWITYNHNEVNISDIVNTLAAIGYEPDLNLADLNQKKSKPNRRLIYQIGIAGFTFGNIMMLSFPEYFSSSGSISSSFKVLFGYMSLVLSIPSLFYSGIDYLKSGIRAVLNLTMNMDVPIALGMITLFAVSLIEIITQTGPGYLDSLSGLIFFLLLGKIFQQKVFNSLSFERDFTSYLPLSYTEVVGNNEQQVPIQRLKAGTRIKLKQGEIIPADCILLSPDAAIDFSFVTGESATVNKVAGEILYAGGKLEGTSCEMELVKEVSNSYLMSLWSDESFQNPKKYFLEHLITKLSFWFTIGILAVATGALIFWLNTDLALSLKSFTSVLIIACPCALALSIPFALGNALRLLVRKDVYIKNTNIIDELTRTDYLIFDKTGTITSRNIRSISYDGEELTQNDLDRIKSLANESTHTLAQPIAQKINGSLLPVSQYSEGNGTGIQGVIKGELVQLGTRAFLGLGADHNSRGTEVWIKVDGKIKGFFSIKLDMRNGIKKLIDRLKGSFRLGLLSGDNDFEYINMRKVFGNDSLLYFQQTPYSKLQTISNFQQQGHKVLMIGDGLNDAGALAKSNVGIAVTEEIGGFTPASDIIMNVNNLNQLDKILEFSRLSVRIVYFNFFISISYNLIGLYFAVQGLLSPVIAAILMPLSSFSVVLVAILGTQIAYKKTFKRSVISSPPKT